MRRILYLGFDVTYINPTRELLILAFSYSQDLTLYGPGYQPDKVLAKGLESFIERNGPYDFIVTDEFTIQDFEKLTEQKKISFKNYACRFDRHLLLMGREYHDFMKTYRGLRVICLLQSDYYNFTEQRIEAIREIADFYITWGPEFIQDRSEVTIQPTGGTIDQHIYSNWTSHYQDFVSEENQNVISIPHFVSSSELDNTPLSMRPKQWSIPGAHYEARLKIMEVLSQHGIKNNAKNLPYVFSLFCKLHINPYSHYWSIALLQYLFRRTLKKARYAYTCGSVAKMAIRKYFEIPASGCVLVCDRPSGFAQLGFEDHKNAIVTGSEDILDVHHWLTSNPEQAQQIADNGRLLVQNMHSIPARGQQLAKTFQLIHENRFKGNYWSNGELVFR